MFRSLKELLYTSQIQKHFDSAKLNDRKELMKTKKLYPLLTLLQGSEKKQKHELIAEVIRKVQSKNSVQKLKGLVAIHYFIRQTWNPLLIKFIESLRTSGVSLTSFEGGQSQRQVSLYIQKEIISYYQQYLQKFCRKEQTLRFSRGFFPDQEKADMVEVVSHGFQAINLCYLILKTQESFNKMGRYYIDHTEMISLFLMYLSDLTGCNTFIKNVARLLVKAPEDNNPEEIRHNFLFLTESQKISDRLSEFYFNRYYFPWVQTLFQIPKFMTINCESFDKVRKSAKKIDYKMVKLVKRSSEGSSWRDKSIASQGNLSNPDMNSSLEIDLMAKTMGGYPQLRRRGSGSQGFLGISHRKIKLPDLQFLVENEQENIVVEVQEHKETSFGNGIEISKKLFGDQPDIGQSEIGLKQSG